MIGHFLPRFITQPLRDLKGRVSLAHALDQFMQDPRRAAEQPGTVFDRLVDAWGNSGWSGQTEFLRTCVMQALDCDGPILECGSGLSTLLVGHVAQSRDLPMWTLEHLPDWAVRVQDALDRRSIAAVRLFSRPLHDYGDFDWYSVPLDAMPARFQLVICDGPPDATRGGRYGLGAVMREHIGDGCTILLDDAIRTGEQRIAAQWSRELGMSCALHGTENQYFVLKRPRAEG